MIYAHNSTLNKKPKPLSGAAWKCFVYFLKVILWWTPHKQHSLASHALPLEPWATTGIIRVRYDPPLDNSVISATHGVKRNTVMRRFFSGMRRSITPTKGINYFCLSALIFKKKVWISALFCLRHCQIKWWHHNRKMRTNSRVPYPSLCLWWQVM